MFSEFEEYARKNKIPIMRKESVGELIRCIGEIKPVSILEIGTAIGYSGTIMLERAPYSRLTTIEIDEERAEIARENFRKRGLYNRVDIMIGDATEIVPCITVNYDFILLDGPKGHYLEMLPYLLKILRKGGMLFSDNVLYLGLVEDKDYSGHKHRTIVNNMRGFIDRVLNDESLESRLLRIEDGILTAVKK